MQFVAPLADLRTLEFTLDFCYRELHRYGIEAIYLVGSRACGAPRPTSDHDVMVVFSDAAPAEIGLGGSLHMQIFLALESQRRAAKLGPIDLITLRESHFQKTKVESGSFANAAINGGVKLL